ncbi:MAG: hypothetical protein ACLQKA_03480 [Bryobacteraceae bacterium]
MISRIRVDLTRVSNLDLSQARRARLPARQAPAFGEQTALRAGLTAIAAAGRPNSGAIEDLLAAQDASSVPVDLVGGIRGTSRPSSSDLTLALGETASAGAVISLSMGGGVYIWIPKREIGLYGSVGVGLVTNAGFSGGIQVTVLFGPAPVYLGGESLAVGVEFSFPGLKVIGFGGFLLFSSTWELRGFSYAMTGGLSAFPVDVTVQTSMTGLRPLGRI